MRRFHIFDDNFAWPNKNAQRDKGQRGKARARGYTEVCVRIVTGGMVSCLYLVLAVAV